jgi:hypothetical protein
MKFIAALLTILIGSVAMARPISLSGRILSTANVAVESPYVQFKVVIQNSVSCVLYQELHNVDMTASNGYFKIVAGNGNVSFGSNGFNVFTANKNYVCLDGSTWAGLNDIRQIAVSVKVDSDPWVDFSSEPVNSIAYANEAETLQGKSSSDFLLSNTNVTQSKMESISTNINAILDMATGSSGVYATQSALTAALANKEDKRPAGTQYLVQSNNLSDVSNPAAARANLSLGTLSTKNSIDNIDIVGLSWTKLTGIPTTFAPTAHSHSIGDITNLATTLSTKADKSDFSCSASQVMQFVSATGNFACFDIISSGDVTGSISASVLSKIQGKSLLVTSPQDQDVLSFNVTTNRWENRPNNLATGSITTSGDITAANITATKQIAGATVSNLAINAATLDFSSGNTIILSHSCATPIDLSNLKDGGVYTFVNTDTAGTSKCVFTANNVSGALIRYSPSNTNRVGGGAVSVYGIIRANNYILIAWTSGFN